MKKIYDVAYGNRSASQKLDLYLPDSENGAFPLVVFIHGGGFYSGDKQDGQEQPWITLTKYGYAVASLNYRLSTEAKHPAGILDCKLGKKLTDGNDRELAEASPVSYIHPGMPPILLQHGSSDELAPCSQSEIFYDRAKKAAGSGQIEFDILKGYRHADVRFGDHGNMKRVREFLDRYMKQRGEA